MNVGLNNPMQMAQMQQMARLQLQKMGTGKDMGIKKGESPIKASKAEKSENNGQANNGEGVASRGQPKKQNNGNGFKLRGNNAMGFA